MKHITKFIYIVLASALMFACQTKNTEKYLYISEDSYSFAYDGEDSISVTVMTGESWTAAPDADWLTVTKVDNETAVIKAEKNTTLETRTAKVTFTAGNESREFVAEQFPKTFEGRLKDIYGSYMYSSISRNGKYAGALILELKEGSETESIGVPYIVNLETGEVIETFPSSEDHNVLAAISDDGNTVIYGNVIDVDFKVYSNGERVTLNLPEGFRNAVPQGFSSDASVIVGYATNSITGDLTPMKWVNGEPIALEIPTEDEFGRPITIGAMARGCSADGSIVYGSEWQTMGAIYWVGEEMHYLASKYINYEDVVSSSGNQITSGYFQRLADLNCASHNGKYVALQYNDAIPAVLETETGKITVFNGMGGVCQTVDNNGNVFIATPSTSPMDCIVANMSDPSTYVSFQDYIKTNFGITVPSNKIVYNVSEDGKTFGGMSAFELTPPYVEYIGFYLSFSFAPEN